MMLAWSISLTRVQAGLRAQRHAAASQGR